MNGFFKILGGHTFFYPVFEVYSSITLYRVLMLTAVTGKFKDCLLGIPYGLCPRSVYDKGESVFIARRQSLHEGKEMFRLTGTKILIPRFQSV